MNQRLKQSAKISQVESLAERIFIQMCVSNHHGFDESHYVRRAFDFALAFYQNAKAFNTVDEMKVAAMSKRGS